jgi:rhodanese-related sulfurtransferase
MLSKLFGFGSDGGPPKTIAFDELRRAFAAGECALIDVREPGEYRSGHVPGSQNLPLSQFDPGTLPRDRKVVLICQSGMRSGRALAQARKAGHPEAVHFAGGVMAWRMQGGPWR